MTKISPEQSTLTTPRLLLKKPEPAIADELVRLLNDFEVVRWLARVPYPYTLDDAAAFLNDGIRKEGAWGIFARDTSAFMGLVSIRQERGCSGNLGYWLGRPFWGNGFMSEAASEVVRFAFDDADLPALVSGYFEGNSASRNILTKLGFKEAGRSWQHALALGKDFRHVDMRLEAVAFYDRKP